MARINLLPWREERRKARQKEFVGMLVLSALKRRDKSNKSVAKVGPAP